MIPATRMNRARGFSLIEMAVVLFIVVLLLGSVLVPFATQVEQRRIAETQKTMEEIKEALLGYAITHGQLPCPATLASNGVGQCPATSATAFAGLLPWADLGVAKSDAWGRIFRYSVSRNYAAPFTITPNPPARAITIQTRTSTGALINLSNANDIVAVVMSPGSNGFGGTSEAGTPIPFPAGMPPTYLDEPANAVASTNFITRPATKTSGVCKDGGSPACEFDDIVTWLSPNVLFNRMVAAQRLP